MNPDHILTRPKRLPKRLAHKLTDLAPAIERSTPEREWLVVVLHGWARSTDLWTAIQQACWNGSNTTPAKGKLLVMRATPDTVVDSHGMLRFACGHKRGVGHDAEDRCPNDAERIWVIE